MKNHIFKEKANKIHNNFYDYSKFSYVNSSTKITIICPIHGEFKQDLYSHLEGYGCKKCGFIKQGKKTCKTTTSFIEKAIKIHGNKYDYSQVFYLKSSLKIKIICNFCNKLFEQEPRTHLSKKGCPFCNKYVGYSKSQWINYNKNKEGIFYTLKCWNESEEFYKIGITGNSIKNRYRDKQSMPYNYEIIKEIKSFDLEYIWSLEKQEKRRLKNYKYTPNIKFAGSSVECFSKIDYIYEINK